MAIQTERRPEVDPPSLWEAAAEVVEAGQQVMLDRVDLLRNEMTHRVDQLREELAHDVTQFAIGTGIVVAANVVAMLGWLLLVAAFVALLHRWMPLDASFATAGGLHVAVGIVLVVLAFQRFRSGAERIARPLDAPSLHGDGRG